MKITKINKEDLNKEVKEQALPVEDKKKKHSRISYLSLMIQKDLD